MNTSRSPIGGLEPTTNHEIQIADNMNEQNAILLSQSSHTIDLAREGSRSPVDGLFSQSTPVANVNRYTDKQQHNISTPYERTFNEINNEYHQVVTFVLFTLICIV
jgi:hypothetical protein